MQILAVIVTHNRSVLLKRCLEQLLLQTRMPDEILVVNNGSTDNTLEILNGLNVTVVTQENLGSAGGWHAGLNYAMKYNFNYCWLMDDDGYPEKNALRFLATHFPEGYAGLSSLVISESNANDLVFPMPRLNNDLHPTLFPHNRKMYGVESLPQNTEIYPFAHLFNGALLSISAVKQVGNINQDYFIMGDEVDYFYRLREYGGVGTLLKALHFHPNVSMRPYSKVKIYYLLKNTIINHHKYMNLPWLRNTLVFAVILLRVLRRNGVAFFFSLIFDRQALVLKAIIAGFRGHLGKDYK